ncbi:MAG: ATP synthase F0 subunit C [Deltaproteobacteria bacterium]|nr:ATP synthase F0 subunit C [Deltaproteobacteria bacterium]
MAYDIQTWVSVAAFTGGGMAMGFGAIGAAIGEGYTAASANEAIGRNPGQSGDIFKSMLVGQAIAESASIFALVIALMLLFTKYPSHILSVPVLLGAGLCMGLGAIGSGVGSGFPAGAACQGMARQPAMSGRLTTNMLIGSAVCQTPAIFSLVVSFILLFTDFSANPVSPTWAAILGAGISSGFGAIGSGLGGGLVAQASCEGISRQPLTVTPVTNVMLLGQAVTQTTAIYALLVSFILMFKSFPATDAIAPPMALLAAGICMGIGAIGPAVGEGFAGQGAAGKALRVRVLWRGLHGMRNILRI